MHPNRLSRRNVMRFAVGAALSPLVAIGCGGGVGEIAVVCLVVKLVAGAAFAVLVVQGVAWQVESARLDAAKKQLELEGVKNGRKAHSTIKLTDEQVKTVQQKGKLEIEFGDGTKRIVNVNM